MDNDLLLYSHIEARSYVDGPGERTVLFVRGCTLACPGCQNKHLWCKTSGRLARPYDVAQTLLNLSEHTGNVTISGGEPFQQAGAVSKIVKILKQAGRHVITYTGYTYDEILEQVMDPDNLYAFRSNKVDACEILWNTDILVDGRFIASADHDLVTWRGSANQRPIDLPETFKQGKLVVLDWSKPELTISTDGSVYLPNGLAPVFEDIGETVNTRMCGQTR